jgi:hypothetical protein
MISPPVRGSGGGVSVRRVDVQVRCIVLIALGHFALHIPVTTFALTS